jgi:hypothetical protein
LDFARSVRIFAFVTTLQEIPIDLKRRTKEDLALRAARAIEHLAEAISEVWATTDEFEVKSGTNIFIGDVLKAERFITATIGISRANAHVKYVDGGVKPGKDAVHPGWKTLPNIGAIKKWLKRGRIPIPEKFKNAKAQRINVKRLKKDTGAKLQVDGGAVTRFAWAVAISLKRKGRPALKIIERTAKRETANMRKILQGVTT